MKSIASVFLLMSVLVGCSKKPSGSYDVPEAVSAASSAEAEANGLWEERGDKAKLQAALAKYEEAYKADPRNRKLAARLVRGWYLLGDIHETDDAAKEQTWDTAIAWGKQCLAINAEFKASLESGKTEEESVSLLTDDDVPCMYWTASALGKWGRLKGLATLLKHKPTVFAYITHLTELNPDFYYGAADRYWGAYYAALPGFAGRDLPRSAQHFDKSIEIAPEYLGTKVLKASYWAVGTQDQAAFEQLLGEVISADPDVEPLIAPENRAEQAKARDLLAKKGDLFAN